MSDKAVCVRELFINKCEIHTGDDDYTWPTLSDDDIRLHTAPTYLHEWYKACKQEAQMEECHGDIEKVHGIEAGMESVRKFVLDSINYDIATNTIEGQVSDE